MYSTPGSLGQGTRIAITPEAKAGEKRQTGFRTVIGKTVRVFLFCFFLKKMNQFTKGEPCEKKRSNRKKNKSVLPMAVHPLE
jgi:hypothetical protein